MAYFVNLSIFAIVEENMISATVDSFDVDAKSHDDLEV